MNQQREQREPLFRHRRLVPFNWVLFGMLAGLFFTIVAMPNFLVAQERARIATAAADMRNLNLALEMYRTDYGVYPPGQPYHGDVDGSVGITTPIEYLTYLPHPPDFGVMAARRAIVKYYPLTAFILGLVLMTAWIFWFRRYPEVWEARLLEGVALWLLGILFLVAGMSTTPDLPLIYSPAIHVLSGGTFLAVLWYFAARVERRISMREYLVAGIAPALLIVFFLLLGGFEFASRQRLSALGPAPRYYQIATDAETFWILQSTGPDGDYDLDLAGVMDDAQAGRLTLPLNTRLDPARYDPSNGTTSSGDLFRWGP